MTRSKLLLSVINDDLCSSAASDGRCCCSDSSASFLFCQLSLVPCFFIFNVSRNPTPGILINRPNGSDVYKGVPKDYTGDVSFGAFHKHSSRFQAEFVTPDWLFLAECDPTKLPGSAQGGLCQSQRKSGQEVSRQS